MADCCEQKSRCRLTKESFVEWFFCLTGIAGFFLFVHKLRDIELTIKEFYLGMALAVVLCTVWFSLGLLWIINNRLRDMQDKMD